MLTYKFIEPIKTADHQFNEIIKRIPNHKQADINTTLKQVTTIHISALLAAIADQPRLLEDASFIHNEIFPFAALKAVQMGELSPFQFGSLMALWGNLETILSTQQRAHTPPEFVPLFTENKELNSHAAEILMLCLEPSFTPPYLISKPFRDLLIGIYNKAIHLPQSEQGFWIVKASPSYNFETVTQIIKSSNMGFLAFNAGSTNEMIPSLSLQQIFLDVAFPHAVQLNPVIGESTPLDIRKGSLERYRDIALPFPENKLPGLADHFQAPAAFDFMFHDWYHAIRASAITPQETAHYVAIGDNLHTIQQCYDNAVKKISERHKQHLRRLPELGKFLETLSIDKQHTITKQMFEKFNQEIAIINKLKKMRKSMGQLKFRIWDMERALNGNLIDAPEEMALQKLIMIVANIGADLILMGLLTGTLAPNQYFGRRVAHAVLETLKPEPAMLVAMQHKMRENEQVKTYYRFFIPEQPPRHRAFVEAILDTPANVSPL